MQDKSNVFSTGAPIANTLTFRQKHTAPLDKVLDLLPRRGPVPANLVERAINVDRQRIGHTRALHAHILVAVD